MEASDGMLYGAHGFDKSFTYFTPFSTNLSYYYRLSKDAGGGMVTKVASVPDRRTVAPTPLVEGTDGRLYGFQADQSNYLIALDRAKLTVDTIVSLGESQNQFATGHTTGGLVAASDGALYGTVTVGGSFGRGFLFRYRPDRVGAAPPEGAAPSDEPPTGLVAARRLVPKGTPLRSLQTPAQSFSLGAEVPGLVMGKAVALNGDDLAIGVPYGTDANYRGAVHLYRREGSTWRASGVLEPGGPGAESVRLFGFSLSWAGDDLAVGAPGTSAPSGVAGAAYVFTRTGESWQASAKLIGLNHPLDEFGSAVAVHGGTLVVGAPGESNLAERNGGAWVFERNDSGVWVNKGHWQLGGAAPRDYFGQAVAVSGEYAAVGAPRGRGQDIPRVRGTAHIYQRVNGQWFQQVELNSDFTYDGDLFGSSLAMTEGVLAVGHPGSLPPSPAD